jgi:hypothetical protein
LRQVLLEGEITINVNEDIELSFGETQKLAVLRRCPAHLLSRFNIMPGEIAREPAVNAFVQ